MSGVANFVEAQAANRRNTMLLLAFLTALAAGFGYVIGWALDNEVSDNVVVVSRFGLSVAGVMALASIGWSVISLAFGNRMVLAMADAKPIEQAVTPTMVM
jgi:heat shock protein HtpX